MAFDPNAATARYVDSLGPAALEKAHNYTVGKEWMLLWALLVAAAVTWLIVRWGVLDKLNSKFAEKRRNLRAFVVAAVYFIVSAILDAAVDALRRLFPREDRYGRTSQPLRRLAGTAGARPDHQRTRGRAVHDGRLLAASAHGAALVAMVRCADRRRLHVCHPARAGAGRTLVQQI